MTIQQNNRILNLLRENAIILAFSIGKLVVHIATAANYGLQRDAYLYLAQSRHLDMGYFSTPPLLAFILRIHTAIWGDSIVAARLLPALISTLVLFLVGQLIRNLKGGVRAQILGLSAFLVAPAFLKPGSLIQPVIFNHLFWLLAAIVVLRLVRKQDPRQLLWLIPVLGLGWLNKYSIVFYALALLAALLISPHRHLLWSKYLLMTLAGGLLLILPNLIWQHQHNWPVLHHMNELQSTQLVNVSIPDFLLQQILMALPALSIWLAGLIFLIFNKNIREYRLFAWAFIFTLVLIILLRGKFYYTIGAYTILIVFGALAWEHWGRKPRRFLMLMVLGMNMNIGISILPLSLNIYEPDRMAEFGQKMINRGLDVILMWEDGEVHDLPQDNADMLGWDELGAKVWTFYESLPEEIRKDTRVYGENYGMAGSMAYWRPDRRGSASLETYPEVYSFNDAFMFWIPEEGDFQHLIYAGWSDRIPLYFESYRQIGTVENPRFRESGLPIWFGSGPTEKLREDWAEAWQGSAGRYTRQKSD